MKAARPRIGALIQLDASVEEELDGVFDAIDDGETVRIDELQNKQDRAWLSCVAVA